MAWIESHQSLEKNGKLLELANLLCINKYQAIGHLHALWWWALDNAEDGNLKRFSNACVTQACGWSDYVKDEKTMSRINEITNKDKEDVFVDALISAGFIDRVGENLFIHEWDKYTHRYYASVSRSNRYREKTRQRVANFRERKTRKIENNDCNELCNGVVTQEKRTVTRSTIPNLTIPNKRKDNIPTLNDVTQYCSERNNGVDPNRFFDFYQSKGWLVGKARMKDWRACVRTWERSSPTNQIKTASQVPL